ncbi:hypothetical protein IQ235_03400 [Oscillatoriales cyanobacterium LEGE 11467]|uniref:Uncharacterized protein n=1 Tax=Zarconia navalis LEGE 11467 TaxID=1828826 RepID=A0A928VX92_9CYAN|nr:COP23 domain-containing protein [Zarconia navalis]MBE9039838.1 hypothetical protein [Zarconia navalis LEGE 11467]
MKLSRSISALTVGVMATSTAIAMSGSAALAQDVTISDDTPTTETSVEEYCHENVCVQIERSQTEEYIPYTPEEGEEFSEYPSIYPSYPVVEPVAQSEPEDYFFCADDGYGVPTTYISTEGKNLPLVRWVSHYFAGSGYDPETRCDRVSERFNRFYEAGILNYITTGYVNRLPVVCVSSEIGGPCTDVLFTLKPGADATQTIQQLFDVRVGQAGPLQESGSRTYINLNQHVRELANR